MEKTRTHYKRRNYFINKGLQTRFVLGFSLAVLAGFFLNLTIAYFLIDGELSEELYKIHIKIRATSEIAGPILWKLSAITVPLILLTSWTLGYYLTRRIELPLLTFRKAVRDAAGGDFTRSLPKDIPGTLPDAFNRVIRSVEGRFASLKKTAYDLESRYKKLDAAKGELTKAEIISALKEISASRHSALREISKFKV